MTPRTWATRFKALSSGEAQQHFANPALLTTPRVLPADLQAGQQVTPRTRAARFKALFKRKKRGGTPRELPDEEAKGFGFLGKSK